MTLTDRDGVEPVSTTVVIADVNHYPKNESNDKHTEGGDPCDGSNKCICYSVIKEVHHRDLSTHLSKTSSIDST